MTWLVILAVGVGSFVFRAGPLLLLQRKPLRDAGDRVIRHASAAAITALIALATRQSAAGGTVVPALLAVGVAIVLAAHDASMLRLLVCGGAIYAGSAVVIDLLGR